MTNLSFKFQRRYQQSEDPHTLYAEALRVLAQLPTPWGLQGIPSKVLPEFKGMPSVGVAYTKQETGSPLKSFNIGYKNRSRTDTPEDSSSFDDIFMVEFYAQKVSDTWDYLVTQVFPCYVRAFSPYSGCLIDPKLVVADQGTPDFETGDFSPNPNWVDFRKGVYRIWPINYWDEKLCQDGWGLHPDEIVARLSDIAHCERILNGVIVATRENMATPDKIALVDELIRPRLIK